MLTVNGEFSVRKPFDPVVVVGLSANDNIEPDVRLSYDSKGNSIYTVVGEFDVNEYIGSFEKGCSLKAILERTQLMPVNERVRALQVSTGVSADTTLLPKDGVEAYKTLFDFSVKYPDIFNRLRSGESLDSIYKSFLAKNDTKDVDDKGGDVNG